MRFLEKSHILGFAAFSILPLAIFMPKALAPLFIITGVLILTIQVFKQRGLPRLPLTLSGLLVIASVWALTSAYWSIAPEETLSLILPLSATFFAGLIICAFVLDFTLPETQTFSTCLILGYFVGVVILIIEIVTPLFLTQSLHSLVLGKGFEINLHARSYSPDTFYKSGVTVVALLFWPCLAILWKRFGIFSALALTLFSAFLFYCSGSLSAWMALIVGIIAASGYFVFRSKAINCYIIVICLATLGAPLIPKFLPDATKLSKIAPNLPDSIFPRIVIWEYAASTIAVNPILGKGLDTARAISRNSKKIHFLGQKGGSRTTLGIPLHPHNAILQIWIELGLVGALIFAAIVIAILQKVKRLDCDIPVHVAVIGMFFTTLFIANVSYGIWQSWWQSAIWLNAAFIIPLVMAPKSKSSNTSTC